MTPDEEGAAGPGPAETATSPGAASGRPTDDDTDDHDEGDTDGHDEGDTDGHDEGDTDGLDEDDTDGHDDPAVHQDDPAVHQDDTGVHDEGDPAVENLRARVDVLAAENRRLRERYERARRTADLRTAAGLAAVGVVAVAGGLALPGARTVLFALGGTGLLAAALVAGLSPTRSVAAEAAASVYGARARTGPALVADLGLADERVYVPTGAPGGDDPVRLFVPHHREYAVPDVEPGGPVVVATGDEREAGVALPPTAGALYRELRSWSPGAPDAATLAEAVGDALGTGFGLVESVRVDVAVDDREGNDADREGRGVPGDGPPPGRATFAVAGSDLGPVDRFDHPVASLAGVALAAGLSTPVAVSVRAAGDDRADFLVTCRWPAGDG